MESAGIPYTRLRLSARRILAEIIPLDGPLGVFIEPTNFCNFSCRQCAISFEDYNEVVGKSGFMDLDLYRKVVRDLEALGGGPQVLRLYGTGEPLLHKSIAEMVRFAKDTIPRTRVEITTNGSLLTEAVARDLISARLDYLRVSIYGMSDASNAYLTQRKVKTAQIFENVVRFRRVREESGVKVPFLYVKMIETFSEEDELFRRTYEPVADEVALEPAQNWDGYEKRDLLGPIYPGREIDRDRFFPYPKQICPYPFFSAFVACNGDVLVCCVDWSKHTKVGNLREQGLREVWHGSQMVAFRRLHVERRRHENEACRNCTFPDMLPPQDSLDAVPLKTLLSKMG